MRQWPSAICAVNGAKFAVVLLSTVIALVAAVSSVMAQEADVGVAKSGPSTVAANSNVAYSVTVFNLGPIEEGATVSNTASVTTATSDPNTANNVSTVMSTTAQAPVAIPLLSPPVLALLALTLAAVGLRVRARRTA